MKHKTTIIIAAAAPQETIIAVFAPDGTRLELK